MTNAALAQDRRPEPSPAAVDIVAWDRRSVRTYDADGRLHVEQANISKANICPYLGSEIPGFRELGLDPNRTYNLYRDPDELARAAPSFNRLPIVSTHVPTSAWDHPYGKVIGSTGESAVFQAPYLQNSLVIWPAEAIAKVEDNSQKEISCGYYYRPDMTPGVIDGVSFDGVMRDITGNHVALVEDGRAGPDVVVGDSLPLEPNAAVPAVAASPEDPEEIDDQDPVALKARIAELEAQLAALAEEIAALIAEADQAQPAMDSAHVRLAVDAAVRATREEAAREAADRYRKVREAEYVARPYVGTLAPQETADGVYRAALENLGVDVEGVHPSAFAALLKAQPLPGRAPVRLARDAAPRPFAQRSFAERFPDAARIRSA